MQNQTGCKINVSSATGRDIEREIGLIGTRQAIDAAKRAIMEKVDTVVSVHFSRAYIQNLTFSSVLDPKPVNHAMTTPTTMEDSNNSSSSNLLQDILLPPSQQPNLVRHHQQLEEQIHTQHMADTKIIFPCGMQLWRHNNKVVKVKVSNDRGLCGDDRDLARDYGLYSILDASASPRRHDFSPYEDVRPICKYPPLAISDTPMPDPCIA